MRINRAMSGLALAALAITLIAGCGSGGGEEESLERQVHKLKDQVAAVKGSEQEIVSEAEQAKAETEKSRHTILKEAEAKARKIVGDAKAEAAELADVESEIASKEEQLKSVKSSIQGAKEEKAKSTISDGTWTLEKDYLPGVYEAPGGSGCYWALLQGVGGGLENIIENGGFNKHQILEISSPYFETQGCGTWHKVG